MANDGRIVIHQQHQQLTDGGERDGDEICAHARARRRAAVRGEGEQGVRRTRPQRRRAHDDERDDDLGAHRRGDVRRAHSMR